MKEKLNLIILGHIPNRGLIKRLGIWKSKLFNLSISAVISNLPSPNHKRPFLNQSFNDEQLLEILGKDDDNLRIGIIFADLQEDFYVRRISDKCAIISIKSVQPYLHASNISIENFLKRTICLIFTLYLESKNQFSADAYKIPHIETRGCLFDLNGDHMDVIYNTENPSICDPCIARLSTKQLPKNYIKNLKKEISKIQRSRIERIESFIKRQPLLSLLITVIFGILLNLAASLIYDQIKMNINSPVPTNVQSSNRK